MMGGFAGIWQWVIVLVIVLILFGGRGKIARLMGDVGKGISSFKRGLKTDANSKDDDEGDGEPEEPAQQALKSEEIKETPPVKERKVAEG